MLADVTDFFLVRDFRNRLQNESLMLVSQYKRGIFLELAILYFMGDAKFAQLLQWLLSNSDNGFTYYPGTITLLLNVVPEKAPDDFLFIQ